MLNVPNRKCIRRLSVKAFRAARVRNSIAVLAIALTTLMFTALFTIGSSIVASYEQQNFRMAGGWAHGTFKELTQEQVLALRDDPRIVRAGARLFLGMPEEPPFNKAHVEVSYMDADCADFSFALPTTGSLPREGTDEAVADTRVLRLLGVEPKLGARFTLPYVLGNGETVTDTFTLSGWYDYDEANTASQVLVARSYAEQVLAGYVPRESSDMTGKWVLNINLKRASGIEETMRAILTDHGYQNDTPGVEDYISTGVNWGYVGAQLDSSFDATTVLAMAALIVIIILTGYLIIYNIFMISVTSDIRFYGLLKTIGTTGRQLRRIIRHQALLLACMGIPLGLIAGHLVGSRLTPFVMEQLSYKTTVISFSPLIFVGAALFSLVTVLISCRKPGRMAGKVSAIEAVRYTEGSGVRRTRQATRGAKVPRMARANLGRSRGKTVLVILSLTLSVVLLTVTYTFANGFDMDKYLQSKSVSDFIFGSADYFQTGQGFGNSDQAVTEQQIAQINAQGGITESGRVYGQTTGIQQFVTEDWYRTIWSTWNAPEVVDQMVEHEIHDPETGLLQTRAQVYGMEDFALDRLTVIDGDLSKLYEPGANYIAAVYETDDYGATAFGSHWAKTGDTVTLRHVDEWEYRDTDTGAVLDPAQLDSYAGSYEAYPKVYRDVDYTVAACVNVPHNEGYRYFGTDQFVLGSETFQRDTGTSDIMTYLFNVEDSAVQPMTRFLEEYTSLVEPTYDFESKQTYVDEFNGFRNMFLLMGAVLSLIIGLVGVLNFFNAILTSILTRRREFAVLEAIGMTQKQLQQMLIYEGLFYALSSIVLALVLSLPAGVLMQGALGSVLWFFTYHYTALPVLLVLPVFVLLGVCIPLATYRTAGRRSIVDRIREAE